MKRKIFGKTGRGVSEIGMGTYYDPLWIAAANFGWYRGRKEKINAIKKGLEEGINLIDTAEIYSSEVIVGEAIKGFEREELFIATKVWPSHLRYDDVIKACNKSLERLSTSYIDLYQIHWPNPRIPIRETMSAMEKLVEEGKIRYIGVSNFSLEQLKEAQEALSKSEIVSTQNNYSLIQRKIEKDLLPYCEKNNIAVLAYYPLAHGDLVNEDRLRPFSEKYSNTPAQIALKWLSTKQNVFPIPRASRANHVEENAKSTDWELSAEDYTKISLIFPVQ